MRDQRLIARARRMRRNLTDAETYLWYHIRRGQVGHRFRRQAPTGPFIPDFLCIRCSLGVEADGSQHFESPYDAARDRWFAEHGYTILRFWNHEILGQIDMVLDTIASHPCRPARGKGTPIDPPPGVGGPLPPQAGEELGVGEEGGLPHAGEEV